MELKNYQKAVLRDLGQFLGLLNGNISVAESYKQYWENKQVPVGFGGMEPYRDMLPGVPNVCLKVPTGGGKTFLAASALRPIFDALPHTKTQAVVWLVPSDAILEQTQRTLSTAEHPYRQRISTDFSHRVEVYTKNQLLDGQNFCPATVSTQLSIFVLSYDSFRTSKKEGRKAYQENGNLKSFADTWNNPDILLADCDETALIQVIRSLNPVIVVDESHHAASTLSKEMLVNFNPSFVLDLTATPKQESNIIAYVDALQLKQENMVKLPVIVYNRHTQQDVLIDAINIRNKLEDAAVRERGTSGRYIRPIALIQAEPRTKDDSTTFEKVKKLLMESGIPESYIAIKTADKDEIKGVNLLSEDCPTRYIITVNALKEGWDCPFAYVLATIANRSSQVDVEQILGRVLRLPYTMKNADGVLNISYCITSSADFQATLTRVVEALNHAGFSEKDYRDGTIEDSVFPMPVVPTLALEQNNFLEIDVHAVRQATADAPPMEPAHYLLFTGALQQAQQYEAQAQATGNITLDAAPTEVRSKMNIFRMNDEFRQAAMELRIAQFVTKRGIPLLGGETTQLLEKVHLLEDFSLRDKSSEIDFTSLEAEIAQVDITQGATSTPKAWKLTGRDNAYFREYFNSRPPQSRVQICTDILRRELSKINILDDGEIAAYVRRVVEAFTPEQLEELQISPSSYLIKIRSKIESLMDAHAEDMFNLWVEQGRIFCEPRYALPETISPALFTKTYRKTLYTAEEEMNSLECRIAGELTSTNMTNIVWWHRNISRRGMRINGSVTAYPDIIAMTVSGKILLIEPKGDHLANDDSRQKARIGRKWQELAGPQYRYYMVFENKRMENAVLLDEFLRILDGLT